MRQLLTACMLVVSLTSFAQEQVTIKGYIQDSETTEPLLGTNVFIKKTETGTVSDHRGAFAFKSQLDQGLYTIIFSYVGYKTQTKEITVATGEENIFHFDIKMKPDPVTFVCGPGITALRNTPHTFSEMNAAEIAQNNHGQDMPHILKWQPSVVVTSDAGTGIGYTGMRIRGTDPNRTNVLINGIPLNDSESQGVYWVNLPDFASSANEVRVQRGVGPTTQGAGSFGAMIDINTLKENHRPSATIANSFGSFNTWKRNVQVHSGTVKKHFTFDTRLSTITSDGYIDRSKSDLNSLYVAANYWGRKNNLQLIHFRGHEVTQQAWYGVPAQYVNDEELRTHNVGGAKADGTFHDNQIDDYKQSHYQLHFKQEIRDDINANISLHLTEGAGFFEEYIDAQLSPGDAAYAAYGLQNIQIGGQEISATDLIRRRWLDNTFYGAVFSLQYNPTHRLNTVIGGGWNRYDGQHFGELKWMRHAGTTAPDHRYYDADAEKTDFNIYWNWRLNLTDNLEAFADLQYRKVDYAFARLSGNGAVNEHLNFFNPRIGLLYNSGGLQHIYLSASRISHEPSRADYQDADIDDLREPEHLFNIEAGYRRKTGQLLFGMNGYYMAYTDQLALTGAINNDGLAKRINVPKSHRIGLELDANYQFKKWDLDANIALSQNTIDQFTEYIDNWDSGVQEVIQHSNTDLAFSPNIIAGARLSWQSTRALSSKNHIAVSVAGKYIGKQYIDNTSNDFTTLNPYFYSDIGVQYTWKPQFIHAIKLSVLARNILDAQYSANAWTYRYLSTYDGRNDDPYTQLEQGNTYNLTGYYPQAGRNFLAGVVLEF